MSELTLETTFRTVGEFLSRLWVLSLRALQYWPVLLVAAMLGAGAAYAGPYILPPIYSTSAVVMYRETVNTDALFGRDAQRERWAQKSTRLSDMVLSRSNLTKIIEDLGLYRDEVESLGMVEAVEEMRRQLRIRGREGESMVIDYSGQDPKLVFQVAERVIKDLREVPGQYAQEQAESTKKFLEAQVAAIAADLESKEIELARFLAANPEFALDDAATAQGTVGATIRAAEKDSTSQASSVNRQSAQLSALRRQAERLRQSLSKPTFVPPPVATPEISAEDRQKIAAAERSLAQAREKLRDRLERFTDRHPDVVAARKEVASALAAVQSAKASASTTSAAPATPAVDGEEARRRAQAELRKIEAAIAAAASRQRSGAGASTPSIAVDAANDVVEAETTWVSLKRDVDTARERYEQMERRLFSAATVASVESAGGAQMVVVDAPYEPQRPSARGPRRTAALLFLAVMILGALFAFALVLFDDRIYDESDLRGTKLGPIAHALPVASNQAKAAS